MNDNNKTEMIRALRNRTTKLQREGDYWDQEEIEKLKDMFNEGVGISDIALQLQRTEPAVQQQIEKLDLYRRKDRPQRRKQNNKRCEYADNCPHTPETCPKFRKCREEGMECSESMKNC